MIYIANSILDMVVQYSPFLCIIIFVEDVKLTLVVSADPGSQRAGGQGAR